MKNAAVNRNIALQMLNPSAKDLEHGLELHKNSFVFDAYGFSPLCADRSERESELVAQGASRDEISFLGFHKNRIMCFHLCLTSFVGNNKF